MLSSSRTVMARKGASWIHSKIRTDWTARTLPGNKRLLDRPHTWRALALIAGAGRSSYWSTRGGWTAFVNCRELTETSWKCCDCRVNDLQYTTVKTHRVINQPYPSEQAWDTCILTTLSFCIYLLKMFDPITFGFNHRNGSFLVPDKSSYFLILSKIRHATDRCWF